MTGPDHDDDFEAYLKRRTVLPGGASVDELEPPTDLDARILKQAREAIQPRLSTAGGTKSSRWAIPLALAATILLSLSVVLNISLNTNHPHVATTEQALSTAANTTSLPAPAAPAAPAASATPAAPVAPAAPASPAPDASPAPAATAAPPARVAEAAPAARAEATPPPPPVAFNAPPLAEQAPAPAALAKAMSDAPRADSADTGARADRQFKRSAATEPKDPKVWLQHIETLRAAGKIAEADAEMHRFRAHFPDYPLNPTTPSPSEPPN